MGWEILPPEAPIWVSRCCPTECIEERKRLQAERNQLRTEHTERGEILNLFCTLLGVEDYVQATAAIRRIKAELERQKELYAAHIGDEHDNCGVAINQRLKAENERLRNELKLCNRSRKWWRSLAYEANAEKISCRAATIKQNEQAKAALREVENGPKNR